MTTQNPPKQTEIVNGGSRGLSGADIPTTIDELTSEWLTRSLRETGVLREARVTGVGHEILGAGEGFMGRVIRLHLKLDRPEEGAPETLIAKLPTNLKENRAIGELLGAYEREILFYGGVAPRLSVRSPRSYYSAMEGSGTSQREADGAAKLDRSPGPDPALAEGGERPREPPRLLRGIL